MHAFCLDLVMMLTLYEDLDQIKASLSNIVPARQWLLDWKAEVENYTEKVTTKYLEFGKVM